MTGNSRHTMAMAISAGRLRMRVATTAMNGNAT